MPSEFLLAFNFLCITNFLQSWAESQITEAGVSQGVTHTHTHTHNLVDEGAVSTGSLGEHLSWKVNRTVGTVSQLTCLRKLHLWGETSTC